MKQTRYTLITVFALIGMLFVLSPSHLRADEIRIMSKAFQMDDYHTGETLFDRLSLDVSKQFAQTATEMAVECDSLPEMQHMTFSNGTTAGQFLEYTRGKGCQTKLFGRITASLMEPPKHVEQVFVYGVLLMR